MRLRVTCLGAGSKEAALCLLSCCTLPCPSYQQPLPPSLSVADDWTGIFSPMLLTFPSALCQRRYTRATPDRMCHLVGTSHMMVYVNGVSLEVVQRMYNPMTLHIVTLSISEDWTEAIAETGTQEQ